MKNTIAHYSLTALLTVSSSLSLALDIQTDLGISLTHSDNALLVNENEESDLERTARIGLSLREDSTRVQATLDYSIENTSFQDDTSSEETVIEGIARAEFAIIPRFLAWDFDAITENLQRNQQQADILANREIRNIVSTGPSATFRLSSVDTLELSGRYIDTSFEDTDSSDNTRYIGSASWSHRLPRNHSLSVGTSYSDTDFDDESISNIETIAAYIGYRSTIRDSRFSIRAGYSESERDNSQKSSGPTLEASFVNQSDRQTISLTALTMRTDSSIGIGGTDSVIGGDLSSDDSNFEDIDIVERSTISGEYANRMLCPSCTTTLFIRYDDQDFDVLASDESALETGIRFNYRIRENLDSTFALRRRSIDFKSQDRDDDVDTLELNLSYNALPALVVRGGIAYEERTSSIGMLDYEELQFTIALSYEFN